MYREGVSGAPREVTVATVEKAAGDHFACGFFPVREPTYNEGFCQGAFASMRALQGAFHEQH
jgi:hypothetical protein